MLIKIKLIFVLRIVNNEYLLIYEWFKLDFP